MRGMCAFRLNCRLWEFLIFVSCLVGWSVAISHSDAMAAEKHVYPGQSIQAAIDAAVKGDVIVVHEGIYVGNVSFSGKAITVRGTEPDNPAVVDATVIDGNCAGNVVIFANGEGNDSVLSGITIQNGMSDGSGGGILCRSSSPVIANCTVKENYAKDGNEKVIIQILASSNYKVGLSDHVDYIDTVTIIDDDNRPTVCIGYTPNNPMDGPTVSEGTKTVPKFRVSRTGGDNANKLIVEFVLSGTAWYDVDYTTDPKPGYLPAPWQPGHGWVTIQAKSDYAYINVTIRDDKTKGEGDETINCELLTQSSYTLGGAKSAIIIIRDNDY